MGDRINRRVTWATFAGSARAPMGLQHHELQVTQALDAFRNSEWSFDTRSVGSLRSRAAADVRLPLGLLAKGPPVLARALGQFAYRGTGFVHRFDLRLPPARGPEVVTIHDLPPLRFRDEGGLADWSLESARRALAVICPSSFAGSEVSTLLGVSRDRVFVVPNGVATVFQEAQPLAAHETATMGIRGKFVLHVGGASERKNLSALADAWLEVSPRLPHAYLVLAGPPDERRDLAFEGCPRTVKTGYLVASEVARLMAAATVVVVPSLYEGFGLPAIEAMASGSPVVAARAGALPEVCGEAALLVEPDGRSLANAVARVFEDGELRETLVALGRARAAEFSWGRAALGHLAAYEQAFAAERSDAP